MQPEPDTQVVPPRRQDDPPAPSRAEPEAEPLLLRRWVGRYELIHRIAHGGMATVYLGRAKGKAGFEKIVAVKVIHPHLASEAEFVGMFLDEARIAARIHHPHVVEILDLGQSDGAHYMVMEFIEGENLAALIRALDGERLPVPVVLQVMADTLEGLAAAHELRDADGHPYELVHRDVSPHNILINLNGWAKVGDFGIMKAAGKASNTKTGELRGKLAYMSPEQARGDGRVDHRTDLFAVGVITWELLTGRRLFACATEAATLEKVIACEVPALDGARPELAEHPRLREGLDDLLARALAADPERRHADAGAMLSDVKRLLRLADELPLEADTSAARGEPRGYLGQQMRRFFRRRVDYARAALRRTGEHDALVADAHEWLVEPTKQVARPPTGSNPTLDDLAMTPSGGLALGTSGSDPGWLSESSRPGLASASGSTSASASGVDGAKPGLAQWTMWLLLPMLGAGLAVAAMLAIGPERGATATPDPNPSPGERPSAAETDSTQTEPDAVPPSKRAAPNSLAAAEYKPVPQKPAGMIRWWFSTTPTGAQVFIAGEPRGHTPTFVHVPVGEDPLDIRLELDGYEPHTLQLPPANDQSFSPRLQPVAPKPSASKSLKRPRKLTKGKALAPKPTSHDAGETDPGKKGFVPVPDSLRDSGG
ncbi:Serine/threonine-protein kinase pkn6 [Enhygromyxa salina]|uniref:Serine/threonine-protein kinase pkn6 n=1 Tax=Enhygromyxa salina TaxID=215803 RepID=A0A2S9YEN5_9BACT|nr:serine/threonine-protein kinase [Enhygromyxa salina]PRQ03575.1 Serine/threonine-protein kinase pkn6 [Enhygromyxa salina]